MAVVSEASKAIQMDRINNKLSFLNDEIKKTMNQMNQIYLEFDNKRETTKDYNGISMGELKYKKRQYDDKKNHLMSCITSMERQINKIPTEDKDYDDDFVNDFLERVANIEKEEKESMASSQISTFSLNGSSYTKTKSGVIVPGGKQLIQLQAARTSTGYACRATTFASLLKKVITGYKTVYYYGSNGQLSSASLFSQLKGSFPSFYTSSKYAELSPTFDKGYWAFDCSGLLRAVLWGWRGDTSQSHGGSSVGKGSVVPWDTSGVMIKKCPAGSNPMPGGYADRNFSNIVVGECVWVQGHIGAYVGNNQCAECTPRWDNCAQISTLGNVASGNKSRTWTAHGKLPYIDYTNTMTDNLGDGWIAGDGTGGGTTTGGILAQIGYVNGVNASDLYESDNFYGYGEKTEFIERTGDSSIVRIVLSKATTVHTLASTLSMTPNNLLALNPSLQSENSNRLSSRSTLNSGTKLYIPASAYTAAKEMATSTFNNASTQINEIDKILSTFQDETLAMASSSYTTSASKAASTDIAQVLTLASSQAQKPVNLGNGIATQATNYATVSSGAQTNSEKMRSYKGWTRVYDTGPFKGYADARIIIVNSGQTRVLRTVVSPTGFSEVFSNSVNLQQTAGGWFIGRHGENVVNLTITGIMLDTDANAEKHAFIEEWRNYMTDKKSTRTGLFYNNSSIKIQLEGMRYEGILNSINFTKDANRPSAYNFTMNFSCVDYKISRNIAGAMSRLGKITTDIAVFSSASKISLNNDSDKPTQVMAMGLYKTMIKK